MVPNKMPLVSVVIPCYNYGRYVLETVESVYRSTYPNIEVVIVNDGSTDQHTLDVLADLEEMEKDKCTVLHQSNQGLPAARNAGITAARGQYVLPLDADDLIANTFIETGVWLLEECLQYSFVYSDTRLFGLRNYTWATPPYNFYELLLHNIIPATALMRKTAWAAVHGYDETMRQGYEDWDFWIRLGRAGHTGYKIKDDLFFYRKHGSSMLAQSNQHHDALVKYVRQKNRPLYVNPLVQAKIIQATWPSVLRRHLGRFGFYQRLAHWHYRIIMRHKDVHFFSMKNFHRQALANPVVKRTFPGDAGGRARTGVLVILPWLEVGGVEQVFYNIISALDRTRIAVYIATTLDSNNPWKERFTPLTDGIFVLPSFVQDHHQACRFILDLISNKSISTVHISNSKLGYYLAPRIKCAFPGVKIIDLLHMDEPHQPWDYFRVSDLVKKDLDQRVVLSDYFKNLLVEKFAEDPHRVAVIPNGIDLGPFQFLSGDGKSARIRQGILQIAFVGRMHKQKQPLQFLQIARSLVEEGEQTRFIMVGDGPLDKDVKSYIRKHHLEEYIELLGFRDDVDRLLMEEIDLLVAPSQREGLPVIGIESLAAGVPVIASDVPGWDELIEHGANGYLVPKGDVQGFVQKCRHLLENRSAIIDMGRAGKKIAFERYDRYQMAAAYQRIYCQNKSCP